MIGDRGFKDIWLTDNPSLMMDIKPYMKNFLQMSLEMNRCTSMARSMMGRVDVEGSEVYQELLGKGYPMKKET